MLKAAISICGRVVVADNHLACFQQLSHVEQKCDLDNGFVDLETNRFISDRDKSCFHHKELYLVRHGETDSQDDADPDITEQAQQSIESTASLLNSRNIRSFEGITSPLLRCLRTAAILNRILGIRFRIMPEVMEAPKFLKNQETFTFKNRSTSFPQFDWPASKEWQVKSETTHDFYDRVKETLQQIPTKSIVVTHYGYINLTAKLSLTKQVIDAGFPPASVTYFNKHDVQRLG
jgi:broad specificity phosphatase PhoE